MNKLCYAIFLVGLILLLLGFVLGLHIGKGSPITLMDMVQVQEYLNVRIGQDPAPPFGLLKVDGRIGAKTVEVWEWYSAEDVFKKGW